MKKQFLDMEEISKYLSISKSNIYKKVANNEIPHHKVGKRTLFDVEEINLWVKNDGSLQTNKKITFMDFKPFLD